MLHPFPSLKVLYQELGATQNIPLSDEQGNFAVTPKAFVDTQYPVSTTTPTKVVSVQYNETVTTTNTTHNYEDEREVITWVVVVYSILIVFFVLLAIGMIVKIRKDKAESDEKTGSLLYDNLQTEG